MPIRPGKAKGPSTSSGTGGGGGGGGTVTGTGAADQVAYWLNATAIQGSPNFTFNGTALALTATANISGPVGIGNVFDVANGLTIRSANLSSIANTGLFVQPTGNAGATLQVLGVFVRPDMAAAAVTQNLTGIHIAASVLGGGASAQNVKALEIATPVNGTVSTYSIFTNGGIVRHGGPVELISTLTVTGISLFNGRVAVGGLTQPEVALRIGASMSGLIGVGLGSAATFNTVDAHSINATLITANAAVMTNGTGVFVASFIKGAGSSIANAYGVKVEDIVAGDVLNRAIDTSAGTIKFGDLAGAGTRMVVADATGILSTQPIPGGGSGITGAGVANQVTFWNGATTVTGSNLLQWNGTTLAVQGDITTTGNIISLPLGFLGASYVQMSGTVATDRDFLRMQTSLSNRFVVRIDATAESGSNAGSNFNLRAYNDGGALIDTPLSIVRAAAGILTISRPSSLTSTLAVTGAANFSNVIKTTLAGSGISSGLQLDSTLPSIGLRNSGQAVDNRNWVIRVASTNFEILPTDDAGSTGSFLTATRAGTTMTTVAFTANSVSNTGNIKSTTAGTGTAGSFQADSALPSLNLRNSGAAANARIWTARVNGLNFELLPCNDANSTGSGLVITRSANIFTLFALTANAMTQSGTMQVTGAVTLSNLAGAGTRMVVADATGILSTQAIPAGGGVSGSGVANQVAFWNGASSIAGNAGLTYNGTNLSASSTILVADGLANGISSGAVGSNLISRSGTAMTVGSTDWVNAFYDISNTGTHVFRFLGIPRLTISNTSVTVAADLSVTGASGFTGLITSTKIVNTSDFTLGATPLAADAAMLYNAGTGAMQLAPTNYFLRAANATSIFELVVRASRGTILAPANSVDGDSPLALISQPYSNGFFSTGQINFVVDGTFTSGQRPPSRIEFFTNQANNAQSLSMRLDRLKALTLFGEVILTPAQSIIRMDSSAKVLRVSGGLDASGTTGAQINLYGTTEAGLPGFLGLSAGPVTHANAAIVFTAGNPGTQLLRLENNGDVHFPTKGGGGLTTATLDSNGNLGRTTLVALTGTAVVFTGAGDALTSGLVSESSLPFMAWHETDAPANNGWYAMGAQASQFRLVMFNDAGGSINNVFVVDRSGPTPTLFTVAPPALFTSKVTSNVAGGDVDSGIAIASSRPTYSWTETDAALDAKSWDMTVQGTRLSLRTFSDLGGTVNDVLTVDRSAATPTLIRLVRNVETLESLITAASSGARVGFRIPPGVAPAAPQNGDVWYDQALHEIKVRLNGVTRKLQDVP